MPGTFPRLTRKKLFQKNNVISEGSIFINNHSKTSLKFNFFIEFLSKILKYFSKLSQQFVFFVQTCKRLTQSFNFFVKQANNAFLDFPQENLSKFSKIPWRPRGLRPRIPHEANTPESGSSSRTIIMSMPLIIATFMNSFYAQTPCLPLFSLPLCRLLLHSRFFL